MRILVRRADKEVDIDQEYYCKKEKKLDDQIEHDSADVRQLIETHGQRSTQFYIPKQHLPLDESLMKTAAKYAQISFDPSIKEFDRTLMHRPFKYNEEFIQIGCWGDGSEVLVRRQSYDPKIYIAWIEDGDPMRPSVLAQSFYDFLILAYREHNGENIWI